MRRLCSSSGFTLVELLVVAALIGLVVALAIRPVEDVVRGIMRVRRDADAATSALAALETLTRDVRATTEIRVCTSQRIDLAGALPDQDVAWLFDEAGFERVTGTGFTRFNVSITDLQVAADTQPPATRYLLIRGRFDGVGYLERGIAVRGRQ